MTREEAIAIFKGFKFLPREMKAVEMAIKALEQEPFINKPCVSGGVCENDKNKVLDKIRAEIEQMIPCSKEALSTKLGVLEIIDRYIKDGKSK